jgi:allantoicase
VELDTANLRFNAPAEARIRGADARTSSLEDETAWFDLLPRTRLQPDTAHRFRVDASRPATHARVDIYPDGGLARVRLHGSLTEDAERDLVSRWQALS